MRSEAMPELPLSAKLFQVTALGILLALQVSDVSAQEKGAAQKGAGNQAVKTQPPKQGAAKDKSADEVLTASDGWPIHVTYFESAAGKESPVVILLAGAEGPDKKDVRNRRVWQSTAQALQKAGFAVVSVDLRKHGDSLPPATGTEPVAVKMVATDYVAMATVDLEAVKTFLLQKHMEEKLNVRKLAIVSIGSSAMVSAAFAVADWAKKPYPDGPTLELSTPRGQDVRALVMYSPNASVKNISLNAVMKTIKGLQIAVHVVASKDNPEDVKSAEKIFKAVELKGEEFKDVRKLTLAAGKTRAEGFLEGTFGDATNKDLVDFLTKHVKELEAPWASRKDRRQD
jgi:predicted alpha/beta hydrolase